MIIHFGTRRIRLIFENHSNENSSPMFRILVPSDAVGAIIGKQGSTVKQIKQTAHAK